MKRIIFILFFSLPLFLLSQKKEEFIKIKLADLLNTDTISNILPKCPKECQVKSCEITFKTEKGVHFITNNVWQSWRYYMQLNGKVGAKIYIDVLKFSCTRAIEKHYKFIVVE